MSYRFMSILSLTIAAGLLAIIASLPDGVTLY